MTRAYHVNQIERIKTQLLNEPSMECFIKKWYKVVNRAMDASERIDLAHINLMCEAGETEHNSKEVKKALN